MLVAVGVPTVHILVNKNVFTVTCLVNRGSLYSNQPLLLHICCNDSSSNSNSLHKFFALKLRSVPGSVVHRCVKQCKRECFNVDLECVYTLWRAKKWSSYWDAEFRWSEIKRVPSIQSSSAVAVITFKIFTGKKTSSIHTSYRHKGPEVVLQYADELFTYNLTSLVWDWYYKACWRQPSYFTWKHTCSKHGWV